MRAGMSPRDPLVQKPTQTNIICSKDSPYHPSLLLQSAQCWLILPFIVRVRCPLLSLPTHASMGIGPSQLQTPVLLLQKAVKSQPAPTVLPGESFQATQAKLKRVGSPADDWASSWAMDIVGKRPMKTVKIAVTSNILPRFRVVRDWRSSKQAPTLSTSQGNEKAGRLGCGDNSMEDCQ